VPGWIHREATWLCACTLGCCTLSCEAGADPSSGTLAPFDVEVLTVTTCEPERAAAGPGGKPGPTLHPTTGGTVGVRLRVTGRYEAGVPANYYYASLLSRDGERFLATAEGGCRPLLSGPPLRPGESREGYANFPLEAKKGAHRLTYAPNLEHTSGATELGTRSSIVEAALP
jgi:hypothetical protein